jgi:proteic killer suppression protein
VIRSFKSKALRLFAETGDARKLSVPNAKRVQRILNELEVARSPEDMSLPGYRFHELRGGRRGTYAVDASGNYRVTFQWDGKDAVDVDLEDYH